MLQARRLPEHLDLYNMRGERAYAYFALAHDKGNEGSREEPNFQ